MAIGMGPGWGRGYKWRVKAALALLIVLVGCAEAERADKERAARAAEVTAAELHADYERRDGADLLDRYGGLIAVRGAVAEALELGEDGLELVLDAGGTARVQVRFRDGGTAARARALRAGDEVSLRCRVGGMPEDVLFLTDCELR